MSAIDEHTGNLYRFYPRHTEWFGNASIIREAYVRDEKAEKDEALGAAGREALFALGMNTSHKLREYADVWEKKGQGKGPLLFRALAEALDKERG